jgi:hypothetical protein
MNPFPFAATRHWSTPVSILTPVSSCVAVNGTAGATAVPLPSCNGPTNPGPPLTATPSHFTEPSGHTASGHVCAGTATPSAAFAANTSPRCHVPFLNGTPKLTPAFTSGAF